MLIKLLIASLIVFVALFIVLVWLVADLLHISMLLPALVTAFIVVGAVSLMLFRKLRASGAARGLEGALAAQAKAQAKLVRPDLQAEVQNMQVEFDKAVAALKSAKFGPGGSSALYFLPWYTIIGPPGAGKSTALRSSGLQFPYSSVSGRPAVKGLGGTRNCDWWLTNEAVVLDTAGRWSTQEEDHDEWLSFLGLLKRYRPRKPLNGLIAAISIGDVANARDDEVEALAQRMRERLDEVQTQLRISIPVYVLFTKCDLIEGFLETFGALSRSERHQVWGFTVPLAQAITDVSALFAEQFNALADVLQRQAFARMADERSVGRRTLIYAFPQQFAALRRNAQKFIEIMFQKTVYQTTPAMRGVYFTSGTQEGRPFNLLVNRLVEAMGIRHKPETTEAAIDQKSYFVHDVFMNVIFEDRDIASASDAELKRQRMQRIALTSCLGLVSLSMGLIPGYAWSLNKYHLTRLESAVQASDGLVDASEDDKHKLARLQPLRERVATLAHYERDGVPLSMRMGMYQMDRLRNPLRHYYASLVRRELVQPVIRTDLARLGDFGLRYAALPPKQRPSDDEQGTYYELLKLYLLLTQARPPAHSEPAPGVNSGWVQEKLRERWQHNVGDDAALQRAAAVDAELYVDSTREFPELTFQRDHEVVKRVRAALQRVDRIERALSKLITLAAKDSSDLTLAQMVGPTTAIRETRAVRAAFTRQGYESVVRNAITPALLEDAGEPWVLGAIETADANEQQDRQLQQLRNAYFTHYIAEWSDYLKGLRTERAGDHLATLSLMQELTRVPSPLRLLFERLRYQVTLPERPSTTGVLTRVGRSLAERLKGMLGRIIGGEPAADVAASVASERGSTDQPVLGEADVRRPFDDLCAFGIPIEAPQGTTRVAVPLDEYQEQLSFVRNGLQNYVDNPSELDQLQTALQQARVRVRGLIDQQSTGVRPFIEALLWPPLEGASRALPAVLGDTLTNTWCNEIASEYARTIAGHYPFDRDGQDMQLADFNNFYQPKQGKLWTVVDGAFAKILSLDGDHYTFSKRLGQEGSNFFSPDLLTFLGRSRDITLSYYPSGASDPSVEFDVRVQPSPSVATIQFMVGGKTVDYYNGPEQWKSLAWPGENPAAGAAIIIHGANGMRERIQQGGPWGLFRLLEAGTLRSQPGRTFTIAWRLQTHDVTLQIDFQPKRGESPFFGVSGRYEQPKLMQPVRISGVTAPKQIAPGRTCKGP